MNQAARDIVVTWPKDRPFGSYIAELERAKSHDLLVNFRVPRLPDFGLGAFDYGAPEVRCYRVHDGRVRGYLIVHSAYRRGPREVERVPSDPLYALGERYWPPGNYIACDPLWHEVRWEQQIAMPGFRGWRWFDRLRIDAPQTPGGAGPQDSI